MIQVKAKLVRRPFHCHDLSYKKGTWLAHGTRIMKSRQEFQLKERQFFCAHTITVLAHTRRQQSSMLILLDLFKIAVTESFNNPGTPIAATLSGLKYSADASGIYWGHAGQHFSEEMLDED
jgi:hypothetical protein